MTAYVVVHFTPKNTDKLQEYGAAVPATLARYNGELLARGEKLTLHGTHAHKMQVIIAFPDKDSASDWYHSEAYQALVPVRDEGMSSEFHLV